VKRFMDVSLAILGLCLLAPLMLITAAAVLLESGRPIFFRQVRVGRDGREFGMYKFRSMVRNAQAAGPHFTRDGDPRVTRVGRIIRRTSVDELPQLLNVVLGHMSLVGPRPSLPLQRDLYTNEQWALRCSVRPGLTGMAQAMLRSAGSMEDSVELDLRYVRQASVWLDLRIMAWTLRTLVTGRAN
jgi:lipopolysaccharide/colanic/teichoic acid biosynthesis glycosyltransferase